MVQDRGKELGGKGCRTEREREREKKGFGSAYLLHRKESLTNQKGYHCKKKIFFQTIK